MDEKARTLPTPRRPRRRGLRDLRSARASRSVAPVAAIRAGTGVVETVSAVPFMGSATAGASAPGSASRLAIRMSDGTVQYVDYEGRDITVGSRVELSSDGYIRKL